MCQHDSITPLQSRLVSHWQPLTMSSHSLYALLRATLSSALPVMLQNLGIPTAGLCGTGTAVQHNSLQSMPMCKTPHSSSPPPFPPLPYLPPSHLSIISVGVSLQHLQSEGAVHAAKAPVELPAPLPQSQAARQHHTASTHTDTISSSSCEMENQFLE